MVHDIAALYASVSRRVCRVPPVALSDFTLASREELLLEENSVRRDRRLPPRSAAQGPSRDWSYLLSERQRRVAGSLKAQWQRKHHRDAGKDPECVFPLNGSLERARVATTHGVLPTLTTKNCRRLWLPARRRWLLHRELAATMGFPVYSEMARAAKVEEDVFTSPPGCRSWMIGNCMHVANAGCVLAVAMAATGVRCLKPKDLTSVKSPEPPPPTPLSGPQKEYASLRFPTSRPVICFSGGTGPLKLNLRRPTPTPQIYPRLNP